MSSRKIRKPEPNPFLRGQQESSSQGTQVLILHQKKPIREMVSFLLEGEFHFAAIEARNMEHAEFLMKKKESKIELCVVEDGDEARLLIKYLASRAVPIPCIVCKNEKVHTAKETINEVPIYNIDSARMAEDLGNIIEVIFADKFSAPETRSGYCRIRAHLLLKLDALKSDVYIRLSEQKYLRIFKAGDAYNVDDHERYGQKKKIEYFFLKTSECGEFLSKIKDELQKVLTSDKFMPKEVEDTVESVHETLQDLIEQCGPTPEVQEVFRKSVQVFIKSLGKMPHLQGIFDQFQKNKEKYIPSHSLFLAKLACGLASAMEWVSDTTYQKLTMAAFFHDITLQNQRLAAINTLTELEKNEDEFTEAEISDYKKHPLRAAELAMRFQEIPSDVDSIITQHHERPDGTGFPRGLQSTLISPIATLFIVAHDLVRFSFATEEQFSIERFLEISEEQYSTGNFKKVASKLKQLKI